MLFAWPIYLHEYFVFQQKQTSPPSTTSEARTFPWKETTPSPQTKALPILTTAKPTHRITTASHVTTEKPRIKTTRKPRIITGRYSMGSNLSVAW